MNLRRCSFAVVPVAVAAGVGSLGARSAPQTYQRLRKPFWAPPAAVFGPVWTVLYITNGIAGWRLFATGSRATRSLHLLQLTLNAAWPIVFFGVRHKCASLTVVSLLDVTLSTEIQQLHRHDPTAAYVLVPYLVWSGYATALDAAVSDPDQADR
jgi:translocator protein